MHQPLNARVASGDAGIDFGLLIGSDTQQCRISLEAMRDHFGADKSKSRTDLLECFDQHDQEICDKAFAKSPVPPGTGLVVLASSDF